MTILEDIQDAQIEAAELVICRNLDKLSLNGDGGITRRMTDKEKLNQWIETVLFNAIESAPDLTDEEVLSDYRAFIKSIKNWTFK